MKRVVSILGVIALLAATFVAQAGQVSISEFDVSNDDACWVAPEWRD